MNNGEKGLVWFCGIWFLVTSTLMTTMAFVNWNQSQLCPPACCQPCKCVECECCEGCCK